MAIYPKAVWVNVGSGPGSYVSCPWKFLLHTTEGSSAEGAFGAYRSSGCFPHFTVDGETVYQHLDTSVAGSALKNLGGGVETNQPSLEGARPEPESSSRASATPRLYTAGPTRSSA